MKKMFPRLWLLLHGWWPKRRLVPAVENIGRDYDWRWYWEHQSKPGCLFRREDALEAGL